MGVRRRRAVRRRAVRRQARECRRRGVGERRRRGVAGARGEEGNDDERNDGTTEDEPERPCGASPGRPQCRAQALGFRACLAARPRVRNARDVSDGPTSPGHPRALSRTTAGILTPRIDRPHRCPSTAAPPRVRGGAGPRGRSTRGWRGRAWRPLVTVAGAVPLHPELDLTPVAAEQIVIAPPPTRRTNRCGADLRRTPSGTVKRATSAVSRPSGARRGRRRRPARPDAPRAARTPAWPGAAMT